MLVGAAGRGDLAEVKRLVEEEGADVNAADPEGNFPLIIAAGAGALAVVKYLVKAGAEVNRGLKVARGMPAITALEHAKQNRQKKVVEYLLSLKAKAKPSRQSPAKDAARRPTGVPTFDVNDTCVLVEAPVGRVAATLKRRLGPKGVVREDILGEKVTLTARCFAVFGIVGQPWSIVMRLNCADVTHYLKPRDGRALAQALKARAIVVTSGDTSGIYQYVTFDPAGREVELLDLGSAAGMSDGDEVAEQFRQWYGLEISDLKHLDMQGTAVFGSSLRNLKLSRIKQPLEFIRAHLVRENAFVPFWGDSWGRTGERVELTLEGLGPDDVERLDYVSAK